jgi:hypothetical protein
MKPIALLTLFTAAFAASGLTAAARGRRLPRLRGSITLVRHHCGAKHLQCEPFGRFSKPRRANRSGESEPTLSLCWVMELREGRFAFSTGAARNSAGLQPDESIAGFKIAEVAPACVKLQATNGQILELCVGMQMKKREEEEWQLGGRVLQHYQFGFSSGQTSPSAGGDSTCSSG